MVLNDSTLENMLPYLFDFERSSTCYDVVKHQINPNSIDFTLDRYVMHMKMISWQATELIPMAMCNLYQTDI